MTRFPRLCLTGLGAVSCFALLSTLQLAPSCLSNPPAHNAKPEAEELSWPFSPLKRPAVPVVRDGTWAKNPIDAFILSRLEKEGLRPSPEADRFTLLRRLTYDLTGLAPTPAERDAFLNDQAPGAYERVVDRLLASPRFGERWAQHWLDVVRYAESSGYKIDLQSADAYRYRDYVIQAFNNDLPIDRFIKQQLAGDEFEPDNPDAIVATGYLRVHPEEQNGANYREIRQDILDDITDNVGAAFLGLTVGCAKCHDHKFDPISQRDYFRLQAFFAGMLQRDDIPLGDSKMLSDFEKKITIWNQATKSIRDEMQGMLQPIGKAIFSETLVAFDDETQEALKCEPGKRTMLQEQLATLAGKQLDRRFSRMFRRLDKERRAHYEELKKKLEDFKEIKPEPLPTAIGVVEVSGPAPATYRLSGGSYLKPKEEVKPGILEIMDPEDLKIQPTAANPKSAGRRAALATWLTQPDHPLTGRVFVNRLWQHYLGQGIVGTPNDFGLMGEKATHPELLDYLATELVKNGWKAKALHRMIVTSAAYRQVSLPDRNPNLTEAKKADPGNELLWHARVRRRDGESMRDISLQISGQLNERRFGPSGMPELPKGLMETRYAWYADEKVEEQNRRSIYTYARRNLQLPIFSAFDQPDRIASCPKRNITTTAPQALVLLNGEFLMQQARHLAGKLLAETSLDADRLVRKAYDTVLGRSPMPDELQAARRFLDQQAKRIDTALPDALPTPMPAGVTPAYGGAVLDLCHALMNAAEYLYVE